MTGVGGAHVGSVELPISVRPSGFARSRRRPHGYDRPPLRRTTLRRRRDDLVEGPGIVDIATPKLAVNAGHRPSSSARSRLSRIRSRWPPRRCIAVRKYDRELLASVARRDVVCSERRTKDSANRRSARSPASWPYLSLICLKWSRSARRRRTDVLGEQGADLLLDVSTVGQPGDGSVDACSWVSQRTDRPDTSSCFGGEHGQPLDAVAVRRLRVGSGLQDAEGAGHERHRYADGGTGPLGSLA